MQDGRYKGREVLSEDEYEKRMGEIISREFFPDLVRLQEQEQAMDAVEMGDAAAFDAARRRGGTPRVGGEDGTSVVIGGAPLPGGPAESLDGFLAKTVCEEDVSFDMILDNDREAHRRKWKWCFPDSEKGGLQIEGPKSGVKLLADGAGASAVPKAGSKALVCSEGQKELSGRDANGALVTVAKSGKSPGTREKMGPPKMINVDATRLRPAAAAAVQKAAAKGAATPQAVYTVGNVGKDYEVLKTPKIMPGEASGGEPLMTWGEVDGTPLVLAVDRDELADIEAGHTFTMPEVRKREHDAIKITQEKRPATNRPARTPLHDKLLQSAGLTPQRSGTPLTALLTPKQGTGIFSKSSAYKQTPKRSLSQSQTPSRLATPKPSKKRRPSTSATPSASITDNLLDL